MKASEVKNINYEIIKQLKKDLSQGLFRVITYDEKTLEKYIERLLNGYKET